MNTNSIKNYLIIILLITASVFYVENMSAQKGNPNKKQQIESERIAFITKQLNLTPAEAQQFWPVYNEFQQKREEFQKQRREILKKIASQENLGNKELEEISDQYVALQVEDSKLLSQYHQKFKTVLPVQKVLALYKAEEKFKVYLLQQVQKNKSNIENK